MNRPANSTQMAMKRGEAGRYEATSVGGERVRAFVPALLPPVPSMVLDHQLHPARETAVLALGRLDGIAQLLPDRALFLDAYVRKHAVLSAQNEGTQAGPLTSQPHQVSTGHGLSWGPVPI